MEIEMKAVGVVQNSLDRAPISGAWRVAWKEVISQIVVRSEFAPALDGIEAFSHLFILFWLHKVSEEERRTYRIHPSNNTSFPLVGAFATRTRHRPNPIGISVVQLVEVRSNVLLVKGLDAVDGTPVLDIKPYVPAFDLPLEEVRTGPWVNL